MIQYLLLSDDTSIARRSIFPAKTPIIETHHQRIHKWEQMQLLALVQVSQ